MKPSNRSIRKTSKTTDPILREEVAQRVAKVLDRASRTHKELSSEAATNGFAERWRHALRGA